MQVWVKCLDKLQKEDLKWVAITMRRIWPRRNKFIFEEKLDSPRQIILATNDLLEDYKVE